MKCHICDFDDAKSNVMEHLKKVHNIVPVTCANCGKEFVQLKHLKDHVKNHCQAVPSKKRKINVLCKHCGKLFEDAHSLNIHKQFYHVQCSICRCFFGTVQEKNAHMEKKHTSIRCQQCTISFESKKDLKRHQLTHLTGGLQEVNGAFQKRFRTVRLDASTNMHKKDLYQFFQGIRRIVRSHLKTEWTRLGGMRFYLAVKANMRKLKPDETVLEVEPMFTSFNEQTINLADLDEAITLCEEEIANRIDKFTQRGSGFHLCKIVHLDIGSVKYEPLAGRSYIPLPPCIANKHACVNVKNTEDDLCFVWSVMAACFPEVRRNTERVARYRPYFDERIGKATVPERQNLVLNFNGLSFPTPLKHIDVFERNNPSIGINVLTLNSMMGLEDANNDDDASSEEEEENELVQQELRVVPLRKAKNADAVQVINLLLLTAGKCRHYVYIKSLHRLLNKYGNRQYQWCAQCLQRFPPDYDMKKEHEKTCGLFQPQRVTMPRFGDVIKFEGAFKTMKKPYAIYADLETSLIKLDQQKGVHTRLLEAHKANTYCIYLVGPQTSLGPFTHVGDDAMECFVKKLREMSKHVQLEKLNHVQVPLNDNDFLKLDKRICSICNKHIDVTDNVHRHHDHHNGKAIGYAHASCNLNAWDRSPLPVVMHNGTNYDLHLFIRDLSRYSKYIYVIPNDMENYKTIAWTFKCEDCGSHPCNHYARMQLIDSLNFVNCSLSKLVDVYKKSEPFNHLSSWTRGLVSEELHDEAKQLLMGKNLYPYSYVDSIEKLNETKCLPPIESFHNSLTNEIPSLEEYKKAQQVWKFFGCQTLKDYHLLYVKCDVLLLTDCMESFRTISMNKTGLDPVHYIGLPGFAWDSMLRQLGVHLELLNDVNMYNFFESSVRGGVSQVGLRYARANNTLLSDYDPSKPTSYILYLDATNLYGKAMSMKLPFGDFQWLSDEQLEHLRRQLVECGNHQALDEGEWGCTLEVDLEYPQNLHHVHSDFPLAPETVVPQLDWLSPTSRQLALDMSLPEPKCSKLIPHLYPRKNYRVHWMALQTYMRHGMLVTKIHKGIRYRQKCWLEPYIDFNTNMRQQASDDVTSKFHKDMNNIIYGKMVESVRNRVDVKLKQSWKTASRLVNRPTYKAHKVIDEDLVCIELQKTEVKLNKQPAVGSAILDISKSIMYEFYYGRLMQEFSPGEIRLLMTDTDSFLLYVTCEDMWQRWARLLDCLDVSQYADTHPLFKVGNALIHKNDNKKKLGCFKDEMGGKDVIKEAVTLRSKMYSLLTENSVEIKKSKGISKQSKEKILSHQDYVNCLHNNPSIRVHNRSINHFNHKLFTMDQEKIALSAYDDKRYILDDMVDTIAHGHVDIQKGNR